MLKNRFFWTVAILGLLIDRLTKLWIVNTMALSDPPQVNQVLPDLLHFVYVVNRGAAFSIFQGSPLLPWLSLGVSVGLMAWAWFGPRFPRWEQWGYGWILSGALGNGIDRFIHGYVVDFIRLPFVYVPFFPSFPRWEWMQFPVFNFADMFINLGIACLLVAMFRQPPTTTAQRKR